jgi:hypothetical protein
MWGARVSRKGHYFRGIQPVFQRVTVQAVLKSPSTVLEPLSKRMTRTETAGTALKRRQFRTYFRSARRRTRPLPMFLSTPLSRTHPGLCSDGTRSRVFDAGVTR